MNSCHSIHDKNYLLQCLSGWEKVKSIIIDEWIYNNKCAICEL